jgi:hypothetical protein
MGSCRKQYETAVCLESFFLMSASGRERLFYPVYPVYPFFYSVHRLYTGCTLLAHQLEAYE